MPNLKAKLTTIILTSAAALSFSVISANADTIYTIKSGDTLSKIAKEFNTSVSTIAQTNKIANINLIYTGSRLSIGAAGAAAPAANQAPAAPAAKTAAPAPRYQAPVQQTYVPAAPVRSYQPAVTGSNALRRRQVESGNNYNTFTGNGYLGAYQFARGTWAAGVAAVGGSVSDFSPAHQDAVANWYASNRYGGWQNVPTTGGW
ncbi:LysM peptidoglycan-binding domain-containing protein [Oenococcus kitaharae]|uniref:LysM peptidoglycan-binding domain-containing protein n=1 Tax=Oenococcus TaxID=46254 RepID=UPI0021E8CE98|nr:LysM peptidoglycan-binding domain-containing protein [Oenococcus kitaharae]MCV3295573.1 LysM peptidoglycan-binding domain-containing protein [Oenococcus kitaharae]